jgi:hypothetical protein
VSDDEVTKFSTQDEAIAAALNESEPGDIVTIHEADCAAQVDEPCDCDVLTIKVGEYEA